MGWGSTPHRGMQATPGGGFESCTLASGEAIGGSGPGRTWSVREPMVSTGFFEKSGKAVMEWMEGRHVKRGQRR